MKISIALILLLLTASVKGSAQKTGTDSFNLKADEFLLFSFFRDQKSGACLALSTDGLHWQTVNNNKPVLIPKIGKEKLMRDPSLNYGKDGKYRLVWTTGWSGKNIGYAESTDLLHWSAQKAIPVGKNIDSANNCWAPEILYDDLNSRYMIYWSSNVGEWKKMGSEGRIYYVTTKDFKNFSQPQILFKNGFPAGGAPGNNGPIDAFIFKDGKSRYILFYKKDDNSGIPNLYFRLGITPQGPWQKESPVITPSTGDEGPSCIKLNDKYLVLTDPAESDYAYCFSSADLVHWERKSTNLQMSHGTVIKVSKQTAMLLLGKM